MTSPLSASGTKTCIFQKKFAFSSINIVVYQSPNRRFIYELPSLFTRDDYNLMDSLWNQLNMNESQNALFNRYTFSDVNILLGIDASDNCWYDCFVILCHCFLRYRKFFHLYRFLVIHFSISECQFWMTMSSMKPLINCHFHRHRGR